MIQISPRNIFYPCVAAFILLTFWLSEIGPIGKSLLLFSSLYGISFFILAGIIKTFPDEWPVKRQFFFIFLTAILCRFFFLIFFPASYDVNRYIWEGHVFIQGFNPYLHPPDDPVYKPIINHIWHDINHKDVSACYPPMAILFFALMASISKSPLFFKSIIILFDLAVIPLLLFISKSRNIKPSRVLLYALNPLVLVFIAGEGHLDAIQVFFICLSLYFFVRKKEGWGFFFLGCATMSKYYALLLLPFIVNSKNWKKSYAFFIPFLSYLFFTDSGLRLFSSLLTFGGTMHYNDSLNVLLRAIFAQDAVWISFLLLILCLALIFLLAHDYLRSSYLAFGSLLLLIPTLHPWYLILVTPFLVFFPSRAWLYLHFAIVFTFPVLQVEYRTGVFQEVHFLKIFEYLPFFGLLIWDFVTRKRLSSGPLFRPVKDFSVVIPTLDESANVSAALESLNKEKCLLETIVVDGGSSDGTQEIAKTQGAIVINGERGRGLQISKGVNQCHGDIILVLHADCQVRPGVFQCILKELNGNDQYIGGAMGMRYQSNSFKDYLLAWANNLRARWAKLSFGDQGQFFRREALGLMGGYPAQMLMEDVELSLRLKENGLVCYIPKGIIVSQRRWVEMGFWKNCKRIMTLCLAYLIQRRLGFGDTMRKSFYNRYYAES